jgi:hypothetical protein
MVRTTVFEKKTQEWAERYPVLYKYGWGPTAKAERWNGRHAMFGWAALIATAYCKGHGLIPDGDVALDVKTWGPLAYTYGGSISNERAIIIVGHLHLLLFSVFAAVAPLSNQDKLYLEDGEEMEKPAGVFIKATPGLTAGAELLNGRLAMLGITTIVLMSVTSGTSVLDLVNAGVGGMLF